MTYSISIKKGGLIAAFFLIQILCFFSSNLSVAGEIYDSNVTQLITNAAVKKLYNLPVWAALLHSEQGHTNINDASFLLSLPKFSLKKEMELTLQFLYQGNQKNICRFPARYLWLQHQLNSPVLSLDSCPDIVEFRQKAPIEQISLVFASEMISQPASMLGHAFLKFSGQNKQGQEVSHAISFYTDATSYNIPKLLFDSLFIGKKGYFSLSPYYEKLSQYSDVEQRNVWEYELDLDQFHKELIQFHIIELKQTSLTYFFQKYNCATLLNFILKLSDATSTNNKQQWITPIDVVKNAYQANLIKSSRVTTPSRWLYRALAHQLTEQDQKSIRRHVTQGDVANYLAQVTQDDSFTRLKLAQSYNRYIYQSSNLDKGIWADNELSLASMEAQHFTGSSLNADNQYNPLNTPGEAQISFASKFDRNTTTLVLTALPISHTLDDDNRNYMSETSLQLFAFSLNFQLQKSRVYFDQFTIFDMQSLMPYDDITGGVSTHFRISAEPQRNKNLGISHELAASGAVGLTKRIFDDIDVYSLLGGGLSLTHRQNPLYSTVESGMIIREIYNMKSLLTITKTDNQIDRGSDYYKIGLSQSKFINLASSLNLKWEKYFNKNSAQQALILSYKEIF